MPVENREITLRDGSRITIRAIRPDDDHALVGTFHHMSPESIYQRFFAALPDLSEDMAWHLSHVNYTNRMALVAEAADAPGELIAVARYERTDDPEVVELGLAVVDAWQNRGLGRIMLRQLMDVALANGLTRFRAEVLSDNRRMIHLLASEATVVDVKSRSAITTILFDARASH